MIPPWLALLLACLGVLALLGVGLYLLAWHRGHVAGRRTRVNAIPGDPWRPPGEAEFFAEMLERERKGEPPRKYQREK